MNILVVDDHQENRFALRSVLSLPDYNLVEAGSGQEALKRLLEKDFAVLLLDVVMPGMDGFELASLVRARARTATVPILFLTAEAPDSAAMAKGYAVGAADYLIKPLVPAMVRSKVAVFVELFRQRQRLQSQAAQLAAAERSEGELRLAELRLATERRYRHLTESIPQIVWTALPDGRVDYFNQGWFRYTGRRSQVSSSSWLEAIDPRDVPEAQRRWDSALASGELFQLECRLLAADGSSRWHLARAVPERGGQEAIVSWLGTFTDIDDQKRTEESLGEFKTTLDAITDAVIIFDADSGQVLYVNQGACMLLGYEREQLLTRKPPDILADYDATRLRELLGPLRDGTRSSTTLDMQLRTRDGREVPVALLLQVLRIQGDRVVSVARDISERKRLEIERELLYQEALDAVRARDLFLSIASHELRTPLTSLQLKLDTLTRSVARQGEHPLRAALGDGLEGARRQAQRLSRLIDELLDVSRITAGKFHLSLEDSDLSTIAREVVERAREDGAKVNSIITLQADNPALGQWDRLRIEQVISNLLGNALKFGAGQPIEVTVEPAGAMVRLTVRDHGIGIKPEDTERIFQRFERAVSAQSFGGLGLGLFIVWQIVTAHGGTVRVQSQPGAGAQFTVELPEHPPQLSEVGNSKQAETRDAPHE